MRHRTNSEIKAYVDGYTACFNQYSECLKNRKSVFDSKKKMEIYLAAVTGVLEATGNATNADRIRSMTDEELADWLGVYCNGQTAQEVGKPCVSYMGSCEECWLDWLKRESEDEW